jgi:PAS domain S-box-containing protein
MDDAHDRVTAAEIIRNFGYWQQQALIRPLTVTHHGRARTMLISTEAYERLVQNASHGPEGESGAEADPLTELLNGMAECYVMRDSDLRIVDINASALAFFGKSRDEMIGSTISAAMERSPNLFITSMVQRVLRTGEYVTYEAGSTVFPGRRISARSFPYRNHVLTLFEDITEQVAIREDALDWEAALRGLELIDKSGVACVSLQGRLSFADPVFVKLTGLEMSELAGANFKSLIAASDQTRFAAGLAMLHDKQSTPVLTLTLVPKSGVERQVTMVLSPLIRNDSVTGGLLVIARDTSGEDRSVVGHA